MELLDKQFFRFMFVNVENMLVVAKAPSMVELGSENKSCLIQGDYLQQPYIKHLDIYIYTDAGW